MSNVDSPPSLVTASGSSIVNYDSYTHYACAFPLVVPFSILQQFLDADSIATIPGLLALNFNQIQRLSSVATDLPILSLQAIHLVRALQHLIMVLAEEVPVDGMVSEGLISECIALQSLGDKLEDIFGEISSHAQGESISPTILGGWQQTLDLCFEYLCRNPRGTFPIQQSRYTLAKLKQVDHLRAQREYELQQELPSLSTQFYDKNSGSEMKDLYQPDRPKQETVLEELGASGANNGNKSTSRADSSRWSGFKWSLPWQKTGEGLEPTSKRNDEMLHVAEISSQPKSPVINLLESIGVTIARLIPTTAPYSDVYPYGRDQVTEPHSHAPSTNNAISVTPTQAPPTSLGTIGPRSSTQAHAATREPSSRVEDEYGSSYHIWPQASPFSQNGLHTADEVPNLTGQVVIATSRPVFEGTYSSVYRGTYMNLEVAIKAIRAVKHADAMRRKVRRELKTVWSLRHPNILPCLGYIEAEGLGEYGAIVTPWCKNGNASDYLAGNPPHSQRVEMLLDVARGLRYLHHLNPILVHGDLKLANIVIDETFNAKICDFGLVRLIQGNGPSTCLTTTSVYTGAVRYLAYELVEDGEMPTTASDVYALACIGLEFLFSQIPYAHIPSDRGNAYFKICREIARRMPPAERPDGLDTDMLEFWTLLERCWQVQIDRRPEVDDIVHHLEQYCSRRYAEKSEAPHAHCHCSRHPGIESPERSFQPTLNGHLDPNVTLFLLIVVFLVLLRFIVL